MNYRKRAWPPSAEIPQAPGIWYSNRSLIGCAIYYGNLAYNWRLIELLEIFIFILSKDIENRKKKIM